ncbi:hypothetical protein P2L57_22130 [Streptomyces ferralitis]|uniref:Secreted protein n=1 Tax=Streptantibioticus ferralitis TaxID=236510 RepID=A0ABT5Z3E0_9ACTN|nr:hypothetical protein [Streptantibioticus ferralitis]MDF2258318.1 hypothetical protein [Streptantibioticus ferralitis]
MTHTPTSGSTVSGPAWLPGPRRAAWAESVDRLRDAATTEPGRLRIIGAVLALLVLVFGAVTAWQISARSTAARDVATRSEPLSADAAEIYRSLADANTTAAGGFLVSGQEPAAVLRRYQNDVHTAAQLIANAAANSQGSADTQNQVTLLNEQLPVYTGLVETARANNRQGLPLGGAYLRYANDQMNGTLLPTAKKLYQVETGRLHDDYAAAESLPWAAWGLGVIALAGLVWAQRRTYLRTNRVFNPGMLAGTAAAGLALVWLVVGHTWARVDLGDSWDHGGKSLQVLNQARIGSLQARGNENLTLVARGAGAAYEDAYEKGMTTLDGPRGQKGAGGLLSEALSLADDSGGRTPVQQAVDGVAEWRSRHAVANGDDTNGDYDSALAYVIGGKDSSGKEITQTTGQSFDAVDKGLQQAVDHETGEFQQTAGDARDALTGLPEGAAVLAVLAAAGAVLGIGRRLSEYR